MPPIPDFEEVKTLIQRIKREVKQRHGHFLFEGLQWRNDIRASVDVTRLPIGKIYFTQASLSQNIGLPGDTSHHKSGHILQSVVELLIGATDSSRFLLDVLKDEDPQGNETYFSCNNRRLAVLWIYQFVSRAILDSLGFSYKEAVKKALKDGRRLPRFKAGPLRLRPYILVQARVWGWRHYEHRAHLPNAHQPNFRVSEVFCRQPIACMKRGDISSGNCGDLRIEGTVITVQELAEGLAEFFTGNIDLQKWNDISSLLNRNGRSAAEKIVDLKRKFWREDQATEAPGEPPVKRRRSL